MQEVVLGMVVRVRGSNDDVVDAVVGDDDGVLTSVLALALTLVLLMVATTHG